MAGVRVVASLGVFLFVLLTTFSAAREERSPRDAGWVQVTDHTHNYLVLLKVGNAAKCSGSILSKWLVLTFCKDATDDGNTKAYAGMLTVADATTSTTGVQERNVMKVAADGKLTSLKICTLNEIWVLDGNVGSISVSGSGDTCTVLGFGVVPTNARPGTEVARMFTATIDPNSDCGLQPGDNLFGFLITVENKQELAALDLGGPVVCGDAQRGISKKYDATKKCNVYIEITPYRQWIDNEIKAAESVASGGPNGTDNNTTTTPSSAYSIHSSLNKYSNWKVLLLLCLMAVKFLAY